MPSNNTPQQFTVDRFAAEVRGLAREFPHRAIMSHHTQSNTYFYNVYYMAQVEQALEEMPIEEFDSFTLLHSLVDLGYAISIKPTNKLGFAQCTVSYSVVGERGKETHLLSGEGGNIRNAVISCFVKFHLILTDEGNWAFTASMDKSSRKFR